MILGVNDGAGDGQFPWIPLLFFILLGLSCTDMVRDRWLAKPVTRPCQIMARWGQVGIFLAYLENHMPALKELPTQPLEGLDLSWDEPAFPWEETISCLSDKDVQRQVLEDSYNDVNVLAKTECDRTYILKLVNEVSECSKTRRFPEMLSLTHQVLDRVEDFHNEHSASIARPNQHVDVFQVIRDSIGVFDQSLSSLEQAVDFINGISKRTGKSKHQFEKAAEMYDVIAFELKDHARFLSARALIKILESASKLRDSMAVALSESTNHKQESRYKSKRRIWVASCTIIMFLEAALKESLEDVGIFEDQAEARSVMNVSSESEYRDFLSELGDDW
jgi:hypothetical protein